MKGKSSIPFHPASRLANPEVKLFRRSLIICKLTTPDVHICLAFLSKLLSLFSMFYSKYRVTNAIFMTRRRRTLAAVSMIFS